MATSVRKDVMLTMGMVATPVNVTAAVDGGGETSFNTLCEGADEAHPHKPTKINQLYKCPDCENVDKSTFKKGKIIGGEAKVFTPEEIAAITAVPDNVTKSIEITLHNRADLVNADLLPDGAPYWLEPTSAASMATYATFVQGFTNSPDVIALAEWAPRSKVGWFEVLVRDGALAFQPLARPENARPGPKVEAVVSDKAAAQMAMLMEMSVTEFDPATYSDKRHEMLDALINATPGVEAGGTAVAVPTKATSMEDQLAAAIAAMGEAKATPATAEAKVKPAPKKRAPAKKAVAAK